MVAAIMVVIVMAATAQMVSGGRKVMEMVGGVGVVVGSDVGIGVGSELPTYLGL